MSRSAAARSNSRRSRPIVASSGSATKAPVPVSKEEWMPVDPRRQADSTNGVKPVSLEELEARLPRPTAVDLILSAAANKARREVYAEFDRRYGPDWIYRLRRVPNLDALLGAAPPEGPA